MVDGIPKDHPRAESLNIRHKIIEGMHSNIVAEAGLIAHGRGEAFDYLIGEQTNAFAMKAIDAAAAALYLADHPVVSVNGNVSVLCSDDLVTFSNTTGIPLEINLFYRRPERIKAIHNFLLARGVQTLFGVDEEYFEYIDEVSSERRIVDRRGIYQADWVFVPLEDGDRTEGLKSEKKDVITVDLNPISRTSLKADITIIDNIIRVFPLLLNSIQSLETPDQAEAILKSYDNKEVLEEALEHISNYWRSELR